MAAQSNYPLQLAKVADLCFEASALTTKTIVQFLFDTEHCTFQRVKNRNITNKEEIVSSWCQALSALITF
jgi:hypothetical protein